MLLWPLQPCQSRDTLHINSEGSLKPSRMDSDQGNLGVPLLSMHVETWWTAGISQDCSKTQLPSILPSNTSILPIPYPHPSVWLALPHTLAFALPHPGQQDALWSTPETSPRLSTTAFLSDPAPHLMHHSRATSHLDQAQWLRVSACWLPRWPQRLRLSRSYMEQRCLQRVPRRRTAMSCGGGLTVARTCLSHVKAPALFNISGSECAQPPRMDVSSKKIEIHIPVGSLNGPVMCCSVSPCDRRDRMEDAQLLGEGAVGYSEHLQPPEQNNTGAQESPLSGVSSS